ncbi:ktr system potassium uptake protein B, partial [Vibrio parahaemolyticus VPTS-2010]
DH